MLLPELGQGQPRVSRQVRGRDETSRRGGQEANEDSTSKGKQRMDKLSCGLKGDIIINTFRVALLPLPEQG